MGNPRPLKTSQWRFRLPFVREVRDDGRAGGKSSVYGGKMAKTHQQCTHLNTVRAVTPADEGCPECIALGDTWVHLRWCRTCAHVGCCDDSKNRHAHKHFVKAKHPIISSLEPGEDWSWCFIDEIEVFPNDG
jgi:hypothetical protein